MNVSEMLPMIGKGISVLLAVYFAYKMWTEGRSGNEQLGLLYFIAAVVVLS